MFLCFSALGPILLLDPSAYWLATGGLQSYIYCLIVKIGILLTISGTTMIEWSLEKATMIDRSRMHLACDYFENNLCINYSF